jgi:hypothetical protein
MSTVKESSRNIPKILKERAIALFFAKDPSNPPQQNIYWIDDVWFHGKTDTKEVCYFCLPSNSEPQVHAKISEGKIMVNETTFSVSANGEPSWNTFATLKQWNVACGVDGSASIGIDEQETATQKLLSEVDLVNAVVDFCQRDANDYGLVLCSFEWFLLHMEEIAGNPAHAAIFDVGYQANNGGGSQPGNGSANSDRDAWQKALIAPEFKGDWRKNLGVRLFIEFARVLGDKPRGFSLERHAFFLTSKEQFQGDYFNEFLYVVKADPNFPWQPVMLGPRVLPKSRTAGVEALNYCLNIFNESFKNALSWEAKELALWRDMQQLWGNPRDNEEWGHVKSTNIKDLRLQSTTWLPANDEQRSQCLQAMYLVIWRTVKGNGMAIGAFHAFLQHAVGSTSVKFTDPGIDLSATQLSLPSRPGILSVLAITRFLRSLTQTDGGEHGDSRRATPEVTWEKEMNMVKLKIRLDINGDEGGVPELKTKFLEGVKSGGSAGALQKVVTAQLSMLNEPTKRESIKLGDIPNNGGTTLRQKLCQMEDHEHLCVPKAFPSFSDDTICFWFQIVP